MTTTPLVSSVDEVVAAWAERALERATQAGEPAWALERRREAIAMAASLPTPHRGMELWRRTDFGSLELPSLDPFVEGGKARNIDDLPPAVLERLAGDDTPTAVVAQRNGDVVLEQTHPELARRGVIVCSMERALREHGARIEWLLGTLVETDHDRYAAIAKALRSGGAFVWIPDGVEAAIPIRLYGWIDRGGTMVTPHHVVVVGARARATVIEELLSETAEAPSFHAGSTEVFVGEDAKLVYATLQDWGRNVFHYSNQRARIARGSELQWIQTLLGGRMTKTNSYFALDGAGAQAFVHGFMFGDTTQHFDLHTLQKHLKDHTTSDLLVKVALKDRARSVYQGLIQVSEGAQRTDAYQANRNLLLSSKARADSIPGLEILANDVRCTHGATIGQIDEEQLFYLMARGLARPDAQRLIVDGFFAPVLDRIPLEGVRDRLRQAIERKIG